MNKKIKNTEERRELTLYLAGQYRMITYDAVVKIYGGSSSAYYWIKKLQDEGYLKRVGRSELQLTAKGREYVRNKYGLEVEPVKGKDKKKRWEKVKKIAFRDALMGKVIPAWCLKKENNMLDTKNQVVGVVEAPNAGRDGNRGKAIFMIRSETVQKVITEMIGDAEEISKLGYKEVLVICEGEKEIKAVEKAIKRIDAKDIGRLMVLPGDETSLELMEIILLIDDWRERVIRYVYQGHLYRMANLALADAEVIINSSSKIERVWVGIDCDVLRRQTMEMYPEVVQGEIDRVVCLRSQVQSRYANLKIKLDVIDDDKFFKLFKRDLAEKRRVEEWFKCLPNYES
ncbi:hypothetical protein Calkr_2636 (plasmid) [Caldicellulosiruptor acetigenus I77R1B]|uniref:Uncharacterized protein n=1 Tax=Caldicellulosiruptor acetigenus (strain ATCC 700853 / DSM 12137 / I77R1B) TaxID=632335 RepID=E4SAY0_CALA7|nr:hypothetical protein [Caldicellulosiruptor acetigenus]ADQ42059.1 hypothetical protein Calkr_2636 [Caldicellulosiruptor acetigenus I77R1B]